MYFIGIDLGTSACKLLLMDEAGRIENVVSRTYGVEFPRPGWSQQDPDLWWDAVRDGVPELLAGFDASQVRGIGCGGQMHGLVALDAQDRPVRPAILWNDGRTAEQVSYLNGAVGRERLLELAGNIAYAGFTAPKLLWMREHEPELFAQIEHVMLPKDYVAHRLTGAYTTDVSDAAGTLLLDVERRAWSPEMLELCGLRAGQLPDLHESYEAVGAVAPEVARELGLPGGVVVAAGAGDNAAAAVGCGCVGSGAMNISLGTSGTVFIPLARYSAGVGDRIHEFCHADGTWHLMGCILSAASCNAWWCDDILGAQDMGVEQAAIDPARIPAGLPYFLPYLMGERTPHNDVDARGSFVGMSMATTRADMTRAVFEGVAFAVRDSVEIARSLGADIAAATVCGGGTKSAAWLQILADVLGIELVLPKTEQGPGYGAAMLAAVASGVYASVAECADAIVRERGRVHPDASVRAVYEERYRAWRGLYASLAPSFSAMARVEATRAAADGNEEAPSGGDRLELLDARGPEFREYGRVWDNVPSQLVGPVVDALALDTPLPEGVEYVASEPVLEGLEVADVLKLLLFGGKQAQLGWCNGHNTRLNCLEYHRSSEFNLSPRPFILLLARLQDVRDGVLDTSAVRAFAVPADTVVEIFATTLHYAPCQVDDEGFRVLVALPAGTNGPRPELTGPVSAALDAPLLWAADKWLLAHAESDEAEAGAQVALVGENTDIAR